MQQLSRSPHLALALFVLATVPAPALAQAPPAPSTSARPAPARVRDALSGDAAAAFDRGNELFRDGNFAAARVEYERAHALSREPRVLYNVAVCDKARRRYARAIAQLEKSLVEGGPGLPRDYVRIVQDTLAVLRPFVTTAAIVGDQDDATVLIDDEVVGETPLPRPVPVEVGEHTVVLRKPGFADASVKLNAASGVQTSILVTMKPAPLRPAAARPAAGRLRIVAEDPASIIYLDGKQVGIGEYAGGVSAGEHRIRVALPGLAPYTSEVVVGEGELRTISVSLAPTGAVPQWLFWAAGAAVIVGGATAAVLVATTRTEFNGSSAGTLAPKVVPAAWPGGGFSW